MIKFNFITTKITHYTVILTWESLDCSHKYRGYFINYDIKVYDSVFDAVDDHTAFLISNLFESLAKPKAIEIPQQLGANDCGLYAIANAAALCFGMDPATLHFNQSLMRLHLIQCLEQKRITHFPLI